MYLPRHVRLLHRQLHSALIGNKWKLGTILQQKLGNFAMKWGKPKDALTVYLYFWYGKWDKEGYMIGGHQVQGIGAEAELGPHE
jgi:hypothetical protein